MTASTDVAASPPRPRVRRGWRSWLFLLAAGACGVAIVLAAARLWMVQGLLAEQRVGSGSMAETFVGRHFAATCPDCGFPIRCDEQFPPRIGRGVCPNCGRRGIEFDEATVRGGALVLLDRGAFLFREPRRGEAVAFLDPYDRALTVKRIAGLPGEQIAIRRGDLFADGEIVEKSMDEMRQTALLVHDDAFRPISSAESRGQPNGSQAQPLPSRWRGGPGTRWKQTHDGYEFRPAGDGEKDGRKADADRLAYHHWACYDQSGPRAEDAPLLDNYGYNQGLSRSLHEVTDVLLVFRMSSAPGAIVEVFIGEPGFAAVLDLPGGRVEFVHAGQTFASADIPPMRGETEIAFAYCDGRLLLDVNREPALAARRPSASAPPRLDGTPISFQAGGGKVRLRRLRVLRDIYLLDPRGVGVDWVREAPLADDEYLLLGDNQPISEDGRRRGPVERGSLQGTVVPW